MTNNNFMMMEGSRHMSGDSGKVAAFSCTCGYEGLFKYKTDEQYYAYKCDACGTPYRGSRAAVLWHHVSYQVSEVKLKSFVVDVYRRSWDPRPFTGRKLKVRHYRINFDYLDKKYDVLINGKPSRSKHWTNYLAQAMDGISMHSFVKKISLPESEQFWAMLFNYAYSACKSYALGAVLSYIVRLDDKPIELLMFSPLGEYLPYSNLDAIKYEHRHVGDQSILRQPGNNVREVLGMNKGEVRGLTRLLKVIGKPGENPGMYVGIPNGAFDVIRTFKDFLEIMPLQSVEKMFETAIYEGSLYYLVEQRNREHLVTLLETYNYKTNPERLMTYLLRSTKVEQGILRPSEALTLLKDYVRMNRHMERDYEKFPDSLKKVHDIAAMNYNISNDVHKEKAFTKAMELHENLAHRGRSYSIILPATPKDLIKEGSSLHHCVASYVNDVIDEKCVVVFLRNNKSLEMPHVTVEVKGQRVVQARGQANRDLRADERAMLNTWAKQKELMVTL